MNTLSKQYILEYTYPLCAENYGDSCIFRVFGNLRYYEKCIKEKYMNLSRNRCYGQLRSGAFGIPYAFNSGNMVGVDNMVSYLSWYGAIVIYNTNRHYSIVQENGVTVRTVGK